VLRLRWFWIITAYVANNLDVQHTAVAKHGRGCVFL
jgi:hypothetical protein